MSHTKTTANSEDGFDQEDLDLARKQDIDALYRRYDRRTFAFLASLGIRGADAEDVHQKAWVRVLEALRKKTFEGHFRGWLFQIMRNTAIDAMRKKRAVPLDAEVAEATISDIDSPDQGLMQAERETALRNCVEQLDPVQREIVCGRLGGEAYQGISDRLDMTAARAHRVFFDAKAALARCLERSLGVQS